MAITRVKICGITRPADGVVAAELGADAVGINLYRGPRKVAVAGAVRIVVALPLSVTPVLLADFQQLEEIDDQDPQRALSARQRFFQMYGALSSLPDDFCDEVWTVVHMESRGTLQRLAADLKQLAWTPCAIVLDTASEKSGGSGQTFNWNWIAEAGAAGELEGLPPIILAGGLTPDNVAEAIRIVQPYAVDVSSGVEVKGQPGVKDPVKMRDFMQAVRGADR